MRLPARLSRRKKNSHKNDFGHVLILAGSGNMLGAAALSSLAAMRCGAGLVTVGVPQSLNFILQKKISPVVMTLSLKETSELSLDISSYDKIKNFDCDVIAIGPGLSREPRTQQLVLKIISDLNKSLVIDADALNALAKKNDVLLKTPSIKVLTPHPGEMARLIKLDKSLIEKNRSQVALDFARRFHSIVVLKGHKSVVASFDGKFYINKTGNPGMATAGSGDVLTGMIAAFLAQGLLGFEAAKWGCILHGQAGDLAAAKKTQVSMIATDIIEEIPEVFKKLNS